MTWYGDEFKPSIEVERPQVVPGVVAESSVNLETGDATKRLLSRTADSLVEGEETGAVNVRANRSVHNTYKTSTSLPTSVELRLQFRYILDMFAQVTVRLGFLPAFRWSAIKDVIRRRVSSCLRRRSG